MTDSHDPSSPDQTRQDDVASAFVDGEATPAEVAQVERDPDIRHRVNELRAVRDEIASHPPAAPDAVRTAHLSAAMAAFDAGETDTASSATGGQDGQPTPVVSLTDRRTASGMPRWLAAAAAVVVVAGGVGLAATQLSTTSTDDEGATDTVAGAALEAAEADAADTEATVGDSPTTTAASDGLDQLAEGGDDAAMAEEESAADGDTGFAPEPLRAQPSETAIDLFQRNEDELLPVEDSQCGEHPSLLEILQAQGLGASGAQGYIPVLVDDEGAELFVFADSTGEPVAFVLDQNCELLLD